MPVGHGGGMSSHPAWVKIIILELIEERIKDAAVAAGIPACKANVYDPFNTEYDFFLWIDVDWEKYLDIYSWYYSDFLEAKIGDLAKENGLSEARQEELYNRQKNRVKERYEVVDHPLEQYYKKATRILENLDEQQKVFNASRSESTINYSIQQMKNILVYGSPNPTRKIVEERASYTKKIEP